MRVLNVSLDTPTRTADVVLTSKDVAMLGSLLRQWFDTEAQAHMAAGFGFAVEHGAELKEQMDALYRSLWPNKEDQSIPKRAKYTR